MPFEDYGQIQAWCANWIARDDLHEEIQDAIRLAEIQIQQELEIPRQRTEATGSLVADQDYFDWPTDLIEPISMTVLSDPISTIEIVGRNHMEWIRKNDTSGIPKAGWNRGNRLEFAPQPNAAHNYILHYYAGWTALSDSNKTNWLTSNAFNLLCYGAMIQLCDYLDKDPTRWENRYMRAYAAVKRKAFRERTGGGILRMRPESSP